MTGPARKPQRQEAPIGKRSDFARRPQDTYDTPESVVRLCQPYLLPRTRFIEPCAGNGTLIRHMLAFGHECVGAWDIAPREHDPAEVGRIRVGDATKDRFTYPAMIAFSNPPWTRSILHAIIDNLAGQLPTFLIFDSDWANNRQAAPYLDYCEKIIALGRVKWIEDSPHAGKDNVSLFKFDKTHTGGPRFYGRR